MGKEGRREGGKEGRREGGKEGESIPRNAGTFEIEMGFG